MILRKVFSGSILAATFTADGSAMMFVIEDDPEIKVIEAGGLGLPRKSLLIGKVDNAAFSESRVVCNVGLDTKIFSVPDMAEIGSFRNDDWVPAFSRFSPNGQHVVTVYRNGAVSLYSMETKAHKSHNQCHEQAIASGLVKDDGEVFITASSDSTVKVWMISEESLQWRTLRGHSGPVTCIAMDSEGKWVLSGSEDHSVNVSSLEAEEMVYSLCAHSGKVSAVAFGVGRPVFATASDDQLVKVWSFSES
jgi:WD40 repeat protein